VTKGRVCSDWKAGQIKRQDEELSSLVELAVMRYKLALWHYKLLVRLRLRLLQREGVRLK